MPSYAIAYDAICQECEKRFDISERFTTVVNLDIEGFEKNKFLNGSLNRTVCPFCKKEFTYEIPMIVFSLKLKFACLVMPNLNSQNIVELKNPPYHILPDNFCYRLVRYQIEALEKYRIFSLGLDDLQIEQFKLKNFSDDEAMPFDEKNIIFDSYNDRIIKFNQVDYNNDILNTYSFDCDLPNTEYNNFCRLKWLKIDRETLKEDGAYA